MEDELLQLFNSLEDDENNAERGITKSVAVGSHGDHNYEMGPQKQSINQSQEIETANIKINTYEPRKIQHGERKHLPAACANVDCDFKTGTKRVSTFLQDNRYDFHNPNPATFLGYAFDQSKQACFKLEFVEDQKDLSLLCYRMDGDAFLLTNFFEDLKISCEFAKKDVEDDGDWPEDDSDDEEEIDDFRKSIQEKKFYLHMERDSQLVKTWLDNLKGDCSADDVKSTLLLMAWNIKRPENLKQMQKHQKEMVSTLLGLLKNKNVSLPEAQCCCNILRDLLAAKDAPYKLDTSEQVILAEALVNWSTVSKRENSFALPVPVSNNIQLVISSIFAGMTAFSLPKEKVSAIANVRDKAFYKDVAQNLVKFKV